MGYDNAIQTARKRALKFQEEDDMILADKIITLRKKAGWSQEELAVQLGVTRQSVSKWEGAQSVPDLDKVVQMSRIFGVSTDYLLKDELEEEEFVESAADEAPLRRVTMEQAAQYLALRRACAPKTALAVVLCIVSPVVLIFLTAMADTGWGGISENLAAGLGVSVLLVLVAAAVGIFLSCGAKTKEFAFLEKEPFETEYGVTGMVKERQKAYKSIYTKWNVIGACICILSPIPLFIGAFTEKEFFTVIMLAVTMLLAGVGAVCFIISGVRFASMQKLLKEGEFAPQEKKKSRIKETVGTAYWLTATAVYLGWSFRTNAWESTWLVWPIAGVLFAAVICLCNLFVDRKK